MFLLKLFFIYFLSLCKNINFDKSLRTCTCQCSSSIRYPTKDYGSLIACSRFDHTIRSTRIWFEWKSVYVRVHFIKDRFYRCEESRRIDAGLSIWSLSRVILFPFFHFPVHAGGSPLFYGNRDLERFFVKLFKILALKTYLKIVETRA